MRRKHFWLLGPDTGGGNSTATDPQAGESGSTPQPQAGNTTTTEPQAGESQKTTKSADDYERIIADLRKENAGHRTKLKSFEDAEKQRQEAELSEKEKLEKRLAEAQREREQTLTRAQERITASEIRAAAADLGFADPQDAARLLDRSELEFDEDGTPKNARALLEKLAKAKPYLLKQQAGQQTQRTSGGATNPPRSQTSGPQQITRDYVNGVLKGGTEAWNALSADEQARISTFIKGGGLMRH